MANESETKKKTTTTNTSKKKTNGNTPKKKTTNNQPKKNNNQAAKKNTNGAKKTNNTPKKKTTNTNKAAANKNLENTLEMPIKKQPKHAAGNKKKTNNNQPKKKTTNNQPKKVQTPKAEVTKKVEPKVEIKEEVKVDIKKAKEKEEVEKVIEHINEKEFDPKKVAPTAVDTKAERDRIVQAYVEKEEVSDNIKKINREIRKEARAAAADKRDKLIDLGILVVIIGLFILVLTTYLTGSLDLSYTVTNYLVIASLAVEAIGIIVIIYNSIRKN